MLAMRRLLATGVATLLAWSATSHADRLFDIDTYLALKSESGITVSPDAEYVAYTQSWRDLDKDTRQSAVWMKPTAGGEPVRLSAMGAGASSPIAARAS
jgi:hypothetical protein